MLRPNTLEPISPPRPGRWTTLRILWRCYRFLRPHWRMAAGAYLAVLAINGLNVAVPQIIRWIIDRGVLGGDLSLIGWSALGLLGVTLIKGVLTFLQGRWLEIGSQNVAYDLRNQIQNKLTELSFSYHDRTETGQLLSRAVQDVERIRFLTGRATWRVVDGIVLVLIASVALLAMNAGLAVMVLLTLPPLVHRGFYFGSRFRPLSVRIQDQLAVLTSQVEQSLRGARVVKAFAQEDAEIARFDEQNEKWFDLSSRGAWLQSVNVPLMNLIVNASTLLILWHGGWLVINRQLTLGVLVAFTTYLGQLAAPLRTLGRVIPTLVMASAAGERIFAVLDMPPEVADAPGAPPLPPIRGHVRFENVSFTYSQRRPVLRNVSFEAQPGQIVALLGVTGSGKSTVTNLIPRFYDPSEGRVLIDGHDVRQVQVASLRGQIGIVLQETTLFAATIRENIAFGRPDAAEAEIVEAAKAAQAHDFIMATPQGYDTPVGERGITLSGGQKQRVAIARALLTDPRILILDDATASVDTETEWLIQIALDRLMVGRTTFVIAHRLSTIRKADLILVLDKGRIAARGSHATLIHTSDLYAAIYRRQLRDEDQRIRSASRPHMRAAKDKRRSEA